MSLKRLVLAISILSLLLMAGCNIPLSKSGGSSGGDDSGGEDAGGSGGEGGETECGPTCCRRFIGWSPISMPEGQERDLNQMLEAAFFSGLLKSAVHTNCPAVEFHNATLTRLNMEWVNQMLEAGDYLPAPEPVDQADVLSEFDYLFITSLSADAIDFDPESGDLVGQFILHVQLVDQHQGGMVAEGSASWSFPKEGWGGSRDMLQAVRSLGETFKPIDGILCNYEHLPESAAVDPEKEKVGVGENITIQLTDIFDCCGRQPQRWWRVFVKVDKGEITNADEVFGEYSIFRVRDGTIDVKYQAPEVCPSEDKTETIWVHNTCDMMEDSIGAPQNEIANGKFEILCDMELEFNYWQVADVEGMHDELGYRGRVPFSINYDADPPSLEGEGSIAISGSGGAGDCQWTHQGVLDVTISGYMEYEGSGEPRLYLTEEMVSKWHTIEGNIEGCVGGQLFPITLSPFEHDLPLEDEYTIEWDFNMLMVKGEASRTLHVP
jgi:hypothetical protein